MTPVARVFLDVIQRSSWPMRQALRQHARLTASV
jgi:hypothetical protein